MFFILSSFLEGWAAPQDRPIISHTAILSKIVYQSFWVCQSLDFDLFIGPILALGVSPLVDGVGSVRKYSADYGLAVSSKGVPSETRPALELGAFNKCEYFVFHIRSISAILYLSRWL